MSFQPPRPAPGDNLAPPPLPRGRHRLPFEVVAPLSRRPQTARFGRAPNSAEPFAPNRESNEQMTRIATCLPAYLSKLPVGVESLPSEVIAEHRRRLVLSAAIEVFAKRGYQGTTIDHLAAAAARIGVGSFYALFDGKEDCFLQAYDRILAEVCEQIEAAGDPDSSWPDQARAALQASLGWIATEPLAARIVLVETQTAGPAALARYEATLERLLSLLHKGRSCSPAAGELPASFEYATVTGVAWLLYERSVTESTDGIEALLPDLLEIVVEPYLGGRDEAPSALDSPQAAPLPALAGERSS